MKPLLFIPLFLFSLFSIAQDSGKIEFGKNISREEADLLRYEADTTANALVLFESGNTNFTQDRNNEVVINTVYYKKIKIFNKEGYRHATFKIPLYKNIRSSESVYDIKAITHNGTVRTNLEKSDIYTEEISENWKEVKFTLPNLKDGCIIEVEYRVQTPFFYNLTGWNFQSDIPKLHSQFKALIPGNFVYNRSLVGYLKLSTNTANVKTHCFSVTGYPNYSDCEDLLYEIKNIPAFKEEPYMTSKKNFSSKIRFELQKVIWFNGEKQDYTTTWEAVDKELKFDKNIGKQFKKIQVLEDLIPDSIKNIKDELTKAIAIYSFIQNYFSWNEEFRLFKDIDVKKAVDEKIGNAGEINIALTNALITSGLNAELVLISTRDNGFPTKLYPVMSDFNNIISKVVIGEKIYFLDATDKLNSFGMLPMHCLNSFGRAMDFKKESRWIDIVPENPSEEDFTTLLKMDENGNIKGQLRIKRTLYNARERRKEVGIKDTDAIIASYESNFGNLEVLSYKNENLTDIEKPFIEYFEIEIKNSQQATTLYLNPFNDKGLTNPFLLEERLYPVDFGYLSTKKTLFTLEIPKNYIVTTFPNSKALTLDKNGANFSIQTINQENFKISLKSTFTINKPIFFSFEYPALKRIFSEIITIYKTPIIIKKLGVE